MTTDFVVLTSSPVNAYTPRRWMDMTRDGFRSWLNGPQPVTYKSKKMEAEKKKENGGTASNVTRVRYEYFPANNESNAPIHRIKRSVRLSLSLSLSLEEFGNL